MQTSSIEELSIISDRFLQLAQQEKDDDLSPSSLSLFDDYTASTDSLPDVLLFKVLRAGDHLVSLTKQMIENQTSNLAELYMGIRTYFDGGKIYNRVQSGSFETRCYAAGLRYQEGPEWIANTLEKITNQPPPHPLQDMTNKTVRQSANDSKRKQHVDYKDKRKRYKCSTRQGPNHDYGPNSSQPDVSWQN